MTAIKDLLDENARLASKLRYGAGISGKHRAQASSLADQSEWLAKLHARFDTCPLPEICETIAQRKEFKHLAKPGWNQAQVKNAVEEELYRFHAKVKASDPLQIINTYEQDIKHTPSYSSRMEQEEPVKETAGFLKKTLTSIAERHKKWMGTKSDTARLTIANTEILLGSILAIQGAVWVAHSLAGKEVGPVQGPDGMEIHVSPAPFSKKLSGAAAGLATAAAGLGMTALGFSGSRH